MGHWHSLALWLTMISVSSNHFSQAQLPSFAVPSTWRVECELAPWVLRFIFTQNQKPTTNLSLGQIDGLTRAVVETVNPLFNLSSGLVDGIYDLLIRFNPLKHLQHLVLGTQQTYCVPLFLQIKPTVLQPTGRWWLTVLILLLYMYSRLSPRACIYPLYYGKLRPDCIQSESLVYSKSPLY